MRQLCDDSKPASALRHDETSEGVRGGSGGPPAAQLKRVDIPQGATESGPGGHGPGTPEASGSAVSRTVGFLVRLAGTLFQDPAPEGAHAPLAVLRRLVVGLAIGGTTAVVFALRLPLDRWDKVWAEDGAVMLQGALDTPWWSLLFDPYAGYVLVFPRLCGEVAAHLPIDWAPYVFVGMAALTVGAVCWSIWRLSADHLPSPLLRLLLIAAVVLVPGGGLEAVGNVANTHFVLVFAAFWALLARPHSTLLVIVADVLVVVAALTDPLMLLLLPVVVARGIALRGPRELSVVVAYTLAMAVQLAFVLGGDRASGGPTDVARTQFGYAYRVVSPTFVGLDATDNVLASGGRGAIAAVAVSALALMVLAVLVARPRRMLVAATIVASVAYFAVPCVFTIEGGLFPPAGPNELNLLIGGRYTILPSLLLASGLLLAAQSLVERLSRPGGMLVIAVAALPVLTWAATDYRPGGDLRSRVPTWSASLAEFRAACDADRAAPPGSLPVEPGEVWFVRLTCAQAAPGWPGN